jgi:hypothetical protein
MSGNIGLPHNGTTTLSLNHVSVRPGDSLAENGGWRVIQHRARPRIDALLAAALYAPASPEIEARWAAFLEGFGA